MQRLFRIILVIFISTIVSCSNQKQQQSETGIDSTSAGDTASNKKDEKLDFKFFYTIANLPSPIEMINAIYKNNVPFNKDLLNPSDNVDKYSSGFKKAINYGVYGIDMAYAAFYGHKQDLLDYYSATKSLSEKLGVEESFDKFTSSFRENEDNKDSLVKIIDRAYSETDNYLKNNRREEVASHVLAGTIIEVQYLSVELMKNHDRTAADSAVYEKIYNQKLYLDNLINLFEDLKKYPNSQALLNQLRDVKKVFDDIKTPDELSKDKLNLLSAAISKVRNNLIS